MKVRLLVSIAGVDFAKTTGELYECDPAAAARLIAAGYAEAITVPEAAMQVPAAETAMRPHARGRKAR